MPPGNGFEVVDCGHDHIRMPCIRIYSSVVVAKPPVLKLGITNDDLLISMDSFISKFYPFSIYYYILTAFFIW